MVCNPVYLAKKPGAKTDYRDALHLAQELRTGHLKPVYHDESQWIELRVLVNSYLGLVEEIVRAKNRLKAVFRSEAIDTNQTHFYTTKERAKELSHDSAVIACWFVTFRSVAARFMVTSDFTGEQNCGMSSLVRQRVH